MLFFLYAQAVRSALGELVCSLGLRARVEAELFKYDLVTHDANQQTVGWPINRLLSHVSMGMAVFVFTGS